jgi:CRISPR-associated protein Csm5
MRFKVTTITPLHIGNGIKWYPFEYWVQGNNILIGNWDKFVDYLLAKPEWEEHFKKLCGLFDRIDNKRPNFSFIDLLNEWGIGNYKEQFSKNITLSFSAALCDSNGNFRKEIEQFIKHPDGSLYLPGSSFKGAIRTAILNKLIKEQDISGLYNNLNGKSDFEIKFSCYDEHNISVEDVPLNKKVISETDVIKRLGMKDNSRARGNLSRSSGLSSVEVVNIYNTDEVYITIKSKMKFEEIRNMVNSFYLKAINECLLMKSVKECNKAVDAFTKIKELITSDNNSLFIQLGKGGNYFSKSLGSTIKEYAVKNKDNQYLNELRSKLGFGKTPGINKYLDPFPKTFSVNSEDKPFGWVKLALVEE